MNPSSIFASTEDPSDWEVDHDDIFLRPPTFTALLLTTDDSYASIPARIIEDDHIDPLAFREIVDESWATEVLRTFNRVRSRSIGD